MSVLFLQKLSQQEGCFILHKTKFSIIMLALSMALFLLSGCGGSKDSDTETNSTDFPNNTPETYNTAAVLDGTWNVIDQEITTTATYSGDVTLNMYLATASLLFSDTEITGTRGLSSVSIRESWRFSRENATIADVDVIPIHLDNQVMSMVKSGADNWRCELFDTYKTVLNITVRAHNLIQVTSHRFAVLDSGMLAGTLIEYNTTLTFRKKE